MWGVFIYQVSKMPVSTLLSPPLLDLFFPTEISYKNGVRAAGEFFFQPFLFSNFVYLESMQEKYACFLPIREK